MPPTINATPGDSAANSYETVAEANTYFDSRIALPNDWSNADSAEALLVMATRSLEQYGVSMKQLVVRTAGVPAYYKVMRKWTGSPATPSQRLTWPRVGMLDNNGYPLDVAIIGNTAANPTVVTTGTPHNQPNGAVVFIFGDTTSTPTINGARTITVVDAMHFSIPVAATVAGQGARFSIIPQELKDALSELAGQFLQADRTLDNDVIVQGLTSVKAGSVALTFKQQIFPQVIPDAVLNLLVPSWLTDELYIPANAAQFDIVSPAPDPAIPGWGWW